MGIGGIRSEVLEGRMGGTGGIRLVWLVSECMAS